MKNKMLIYKNNYIQIGNLFTLCSENSIKTFEKLKKVLEKNKSIIDLQIPEKCHIITSFLSTKKRYITVSPPIVFKLKLEKEDYLESSRVFNIHYFERVNVIYDGSFLLTYLDYKRSGNYFFIYGVVRKKLNKILSASGLKTEVLGPSPIHTTFYLLEKGINLFRKDDDIILLSKNKRDAINKLFYFFVEMNFVLGFFYQAILLRNKILYCKAKIDKTALGLFSLYKNWLSINFIKKEFEKRKINKKIITLEEEIYHYYHLLNELVDEKVYMSDYCRKLSFFRPELLDYLKRMTEVEGLEYDSLNSLKTSVTNELHLFSANKILITATLLGVIIGFILSLF